MYQQLVNSQLRQQYHFQPSENGYYAWDVLRLIELSIDFEVVEIDLNDIKELDQNYWFNDESPTCRNLVSYLNLIEQADLKYPIILAKERFVMDGMHRVVKALKLGHRTIRAVVFKETPKPDYIDVQPDEFKEPLIDYVMSLAHRLIRNQGATLRACVSLVKSCNAECGSACRPRRANP